MATYRRWLGASPWGAAILLCLGAIASSSRRAESAEPAARPNILVIITDQQQAGMMSCTGNPWVKTPAMDRLAATGVRFERAYCANPVCSPSRVCMMTGYMPNRFGMRTNDKGYGPPPAAILRKSLGWLFRDAGYTTVYGGKTHWLPNMTPNAIGFEIITRDERDELATTCADFFRRKHDKPFLFVASFINPHDICFMAIDSHAKSLGKRSPWPGVIEREELAVAMRTPEGVSRERFFKDICPTLPANFEVPKLEPECITTDYARAKTFEGFVRKEWSEETWRMHRWAYARLTERVDGQIGKVLDALRQSGLEENTLVVFTSDHGDQNSAHRLEHKSVLYEESVHVPFIVRYKGVNRPTRVDNEHLVSTGLDLIPTLCDYAGITPPADLPGRSVRALAEGRTSATWRDQVVVDSHAGRMVRTDRFKYCVYATGKHREQLTDLVKDPGEMQNLAEEPAYAQVLDEHRKRLRSWVEKTDDKIGKPYLIGSEKSGVAPKAPLSGPPASTATEKPNIVYILADDMGYGDFGCYNKEAKIPTPNVDRLATEGMRFTDAHSGSAVCSPTRYGILTGRYAWRTWLTRGVLAPYAKPMIDRQRLTVPAFLKQNGYHTACIGKWHLGWQWPKEGGAYVFDRPIAEGPTTRGFDYYFGTDVPNYPPYCFIENDRTVGIPSARKAKQDLSGRSGPMLPGWKQEDILPKLVEKAVGYIGERAAKGEPFFLYFPLTSPHEPIVPSPQFRGKSGISDLADFMMETDWAVGEVLRALDQHGLGQKTLVIFTPDNGHATYTGLPGLQKHGHEPSGPLRGYKFDIWEGGHREPFIVRWPGRVKPATVCDETICHTNLMATCAAILGQELPADAGVDSFSILPLLLGEKHAQPTHEAVVHHSGAGGFAIRRGPWKLIAGQDPFQPIGAGKPAPDQLYNLAKDLHETKNVAAAHPQIVAELNALLRKYVEQGRSTPGAPRKNDLTKN